MKLWDLLYRERKRPGKRTPKVQVWRGAIAANSRDEAIRVARYIGRKSGYVIVGVRLSKKKLGS